MRSFSSHEITCDLAERESIRSAGGTAIAAPSSAADPDPAIGPAVLAEAVAPSGLLRQLAEHAAATYRQIPIARRAVVVAVAALDNVPLP